MWGISRAMRRATGKRRLTTIKKELKHRCGNKHLTCMKALRPSEAKHRSDETLKGTQACMRHSDVERNKAEAKPAETTNVSRRRRRWKRRWLHLQPMILLAGVL